MSTNKMSLPSRVDPQVMADQEKELTGSISVKHMFRLQNLSNPLEPIAAVSLRFSRGLFGLPNITGRIQHCLGLRCERCLEEVEISLDLPVELIIKPKSEYVTEDFENLDFYEYDGKSLELVGLVEDELLLALPLVPKHEDISLCNQDMVAWLAANELPAENAESPFAILKR